MVIERNIVKKPETKSGIKKKMRIYISKSVVVVYGV